MFFPVLEISLNSSSSLLYPSLNTLPLANKTGASSLSALSIFLITSSQPSNFLDQLNNVLLDECLINIFISFIHKREFFKFISSLGVTRNKANLEVILSISEIDFKESETF